MTIFQRHQYILAFSDMILSKLVDSESEFQKVTGKGTKFSFSRQYLGILLLLRVDLGA